MTSLDDICRIGPIYGLGKGRDARKLAAAVDLFRSENPPSVEDIVASVKSIDGCADGWMQWSDDKRWSQAWYFTDNGDDTYLVVMSDGADSHEHVFDDLHLACAHFIIKDVEDYGRILDARRGES